MQSPIINVMSAAAIKAGKGLMRDFGEVDQLQISKKGTSNFVTESDVRTEKLLRKELSAARPTYGFLLEEGGEVLGKDPFRRWIIDPLDGTTNFIHAIPYFCISIALEERDAKGKSEIIAGLIYDPIHNEIFSAEKNKGAFLNNRRLMVSARAKFEDSMLATSNPRMSLKDNHDVFALFDNLSQSGAAIRGFGATALDLAYLAAGRLDACWYHTIQPWDIAVGLLLVHEAAGVTSELGGQPANAYSKTLLATNQPLSQAMRKLISKAA